MSYHIIINNLVGVEMISKALREHAAIETDPTKKIAYTDLAEGVDKHTLYVDEQLGVAMTLDQLAQGVVAQPTKRPQLSLVN